MNTASGDLAASELSDASNDAVHANQHADLARDQSGRTIDEDSGSLRSFVDTSGGPDRVISGPPSHLSSNRLQHEVPEAEYIKVVGSRAPYIEPRVPLGNDIGQRVGPNEDSYKASASSDAVVSDHSDNSGDATGEEEDLYSNVSAEDRQTLENLAFVMDVYATNVAKQKNVDDTVPQERDGSYASENSAEQTEPADIEEETDVANGDSHKSAQQTAYVPEETIPSDRDEVKASDTEIRTGKLFFTYC